MEACQMDPSGQSSTRYLKTVETLEEDTHTCCHRAHLGPRLSQSETSPKTQVCLCVQLRVTINHVRIFNKLLLYSSSCITRYYCRSDSQFLHCLTLTLIRAYRTISPFLIIFSQSSVNNDQGKCSDWAMPLVPLAAHYSS